MIDLNSIKIASQCRRTRNAKAGEERNACYAQMQGGRYIEKMAFEKYLPRFLREFLLERRRSRRTWKAIILAGEKRFAEAAQIYSDFADQHLTESTLQYSTHCEYSMENWIEAKQPQKALEQARRALRSFGNNDDEWMRYSS